MTAYTGDGPIMLPPGFAGSIAISGAGGTTTPPSNGIGSAVPVSKSVAVTTTGAYAAGDVVGGIISLATVNYATGRRVSLRSIQVSDKGNNSLALDIYFFKATPAAGTYTDNAALVWGTGDSANKVGQIRIAAGDWIADGSQASVNLSGMDMCMSVAATTLFALIVCPSGSAPTFANGDLSINAEFNQE